MVHRKIVEKVMDSERFCLPEMEPRVMPRQCGGWLAVSPKWAPLRIGVTGATEREAREGFRYAVTAWSATLEPV